jgi:hypothetical protein
MRRLMSNNLVRPLFVVSLAALLLAGLVPARAQSAGFDLFQTATGSSVTLSNTGTVALQGVAIQSTLGNTDTIIHRLTSVPPGGGSVSANVFALFMKSTSPVTFNGQSADLYVTINNSGGVISSSVLPQPDALAASAGTVTVLNATTFDSSITVNADVIFVKAGTSVTNSANWLAHQPAPAVTLTSTNSTWSTTPPAGYPSNSHYPSGGFFPVVVQGHTVPSHAHPVVPAKCLTPVGAQTRLGGNGTIAPVCIAAQ